MNIQEIEYATHTAYLSLLTGDGLFVVPRSEDDVPALDWHQVATIRPAGGGLESFHTVLGTASLHEADWSHAMADLHRRGWEPAEDDDGGVLVAGTTHDGREVIGLYGRDPVLTEPTLEEIVEEHARLRAAAHMTKSR
jgi:hypothetical protein